MKNLITSVKSKSVKLPSFSPMTYISNKLLTLLIKNADQNVFESAVRGKLEAEKVTEYLMPKIQQAVRSADIEDFVEESISECFEYGNNRNINRVLVSHVEDWIENFDCYDVDNKLNDKVEEAFRDTIDNWDLDYDSDLNDKVSDYLSDYDLDDEVSDLITDKVRDFDLNRTEIDMDDRIKAFMQDKFRKFIRDNENMPASIIVEEIKNCVEEKIEVKEADLAKVEESLQAKIDELVKSRDFILSVKKQLAGSMKVVFTEEL